MEALMQYVWQYRLWPELTMTAADGRRVQIIDPGQINHGSGPDFFNAKLRIDGNTWAGNIEIHVRASDWHRHGHDNDPAYDNVVLHVVQYDDTAITRRLDGSVIPQVTMRCAADYAERYQRMVNNPRSQLGCSQELANIPAIFVTDWISALGTRRLQRKADDVLARLDENHGDWNQTIYMTLARGLGFGANADAMEQLTRAVPLRILLRNSDTQSTLEAILMGRSGLLNTAHPRDDYEATLAGEYAFYARKYGISTTTPLNWQLRQRPQNSPLRRIALLAAFVYDGFDLPGHLMAVCDDETLRKAFTPAPSPFWDRHLTFGAPSASAPSGLTRASLNLLGINVAAPVLYAYGISTGDSACIDRALDLLHALRPESNSMVRLLTDAGMPCRNAFESQALIQLHKDYCAARRCLFCRLGHRLLSAKVRP